MRTRREEQHSAVELVEKLTKISIQQGRIVSTHDDIDDDDDDVKTNVIPVKIEKTGTISNSFTKYLSNIPRKHEIKELHKTAILGTAHILRKVLM
jgi:hypothetical protein